MPDTGDGNVSSQEVLNDYLSNQNPTGSSAPAAASTRPGTEDTSATAAEVNPENGSGSRHSGRRSSIGRRSSTGRRSSIPYNNDQYDYEMQSYYPQQYTRRKSRARSNTRYIPHFMTDPTAQYPIQEVVPNSQMAVATGADPNANRADGFGPTVRSRATTIKSNVPDVLSVVGSTRSKGRSHNDSAAGNGEDAEDEDEDDGDNHALSTPLMVRPKALHQNPQTPTVLPSAYHPINKWTTLKHAYLKEFLAEFVGTMVLIIFGAAVNCQVNISGRIQQDSFDNALRVLDNSAERLRETAEAFKTLVSSTPGGTFDDVAFGWASASAIGYFAAGGSAISGGHLNPSVTVANFIYRGFPFRNVFIYVAGQILGAFVGALILFITYRRVIEEAFPGEWWKNETVAGVFCVVPKPYLSTSRQFVSEYISTALLQVGTFALTDPYTSLSSDLFPLMLFILSYILNAGLSYQTGAAMNMARDLGPRLALYALGFNRHMLWINHYHFFWVPIVAPFLGSITGGLIYDICIYQGHESPVNWPLSTYKDIFWRSWFRKRQQWSQRSHWPAIGGKLSDDNASSDISSFSYANDNEDDETHFGHHHTTNEANQSEDALLPDEDSGGDMKSPEAVHFTSVQANNNRFNGQIPTILEEHPSLENESLGISLGSTSLNDDSNDDSTSNHQDDSDSIKSFRPIRRKRE